MPTTNIYKSPAGAWTVVRPADAVEERECFIPNRFTIAQGHISANGAPYHLEQHAAVELVADDNSERIALHVSNIRRLT